MEYQTTAPQALSGAEWELAWAPYGEADYGQVLAEIGPDDIVLDVGAGDFRLARRMAQICRRVIAIEIQPGLVDAATLADLPEPTCNLDMICADACRMRFPRGITTGVLLMRHCQRFGLFREKMIQAGARRLITNARWRTNVEVIDLTTPPVAYKDLEMGWYACACGAVGFKAGPAARLDDQMMAATSEVTACPSCVRTAGEFNQERQI